MGSLLQEKFEFEAPEPPAGPSDWASDKAARRPKENLERLNVLPPGSDISEQPLADTRSPMRTMSGETDVSRDWNREAVTKGFKRLPMRPTDDQYTGEHADTFYGEMTVDGETGFIERGNVLDRE